MRNAQAVADFQPEEKIYAGQSVGLIDRTRPAGEIVTQLWNDARARIEEFREASDR